MKVRWADEDSRDKHVTFDPPGEDSSHLEPQGVEGEPTEERRDSCTSRNM